MNGYQRITAALRGEQPDVFPVMLHNFMMAAREAGVPMKQFRRDPDAIARCFIQSVERYGYDAIVVDVDTATLAAAVGVPVDFPEDAPARCLRGRLVRLEDVYDLEPANVGACAGVQVWLAAVCLLRKYFGNEVFIRGNCDQAPFSLASMMRSPQEWMMDIMDSDKQEAVHKLLVYCLDAVRQFVELMSTTGAHMVSNGDSPAGPEMISPRIYKKLALPYEALVVEMAHACAKPYVLHICGKADLILPDMVSTGADGLELDHKTNALLAREVLGRKTTFIGNIDPSGILALGTPAKIEANTRQLLQIFKNTANFILNAGCAIPASTPEENLKSMIRAAREF